MPPRPKTPMLERYWSRVVVAVDPDACWLWRGTRDSSGYGQLRNDEGRIVSTHRVAWMLEGGSIPDGLQVLHTCEDRYERGDRTHRCCVNPRHLKLGTNADNVADRIRTGHEADHAGEANGRAKLTVEDVRVIRRELAAGADMAALAQRFGVTHGAIWFIDKGLTWRDAA